jgi:hypothetical protein
MIFYNKYTISIGRLSILLDSQNINLVKRINIPLPKFFVVRAYNKFLHEVKETLNKSAIEKDIERTLIKTKLYNKAFNLYPALVDLCSIGWTKEILERIKDITGIELKRLEDRKFLIAETERLQAKYREYLITEKPEGGVSFSQIIISIEIILEMNIPRDIKLFEFEYYIKSASEKIKQLEKKNGK